MHSVSRHKKLKLTYALVAVVLFSIGFAVHALSSIDDLLDGLWMETANYPASSIIRFEKRGGGIVGKYRQVSVPQRHWGFEVGETVIRGTINGKRFTGEVLLKLQKDFKARCPDAAAGWAPIELNLIESGKLYGRWQQTHFRDDSCEVAGHSWQLYGLEKIHAK